MDQENGIQQKQQQQQQQQQLKDDSAVNIETVALSMGALTVKDNGSIDHKDVSSILQATADHLSKAALTSSTSSLIQKANDEVIQKQLEEVLSAHFHPLTLTTLPSIVVYLLLNYFLLKRENREIEAAKSLYEDHIALLKEKNSELVEEKALQEKNGQVESCKSCEELRASIDKLKQSYDEICHINSQWALDYEVLTKQISNATGFHSVGSANSTQSHPPKSRYIPDPSCVRCSIYESQLEDKHHEVEDLRATIVGLREDIKECKERLTQKQRELSSLENEYQIIRLQIQEIGDLQQTLNMKQDYRKMQRSLQHKNKQYQDAMCEKLELQKQVEKLRQTFLKFFPSPNPAQSHAGNAHLPPSSSSSSSSSSTRPHSGGFYSFPMHSCRHNIQSHTAEPTPPTPPGLLARGDLRGGFVEKDEHPIPAIHLDDRTANPSDSASAAGQKVLNGGRPYHAMPQGDHVTNNTNPGLTYAVASSEMVTVATNPHIRELSRGYNVADVGMSRSHAGDHMSHSHSTTSPNSSTSSYTHVSVPYSSSSLSSLGYVSEDHAPSQIAPSPAHYYSQRSKSSLGTYSSSNSDLCSVGTNTRPHPQKSHSQDSIHGGQSSRPTSLGLMNGGGGAGPQAVPAQQFFTCPNCKRTFTCSQNSFEPWFQHVRFCAV